MTHDPRDKLAPIVPSFVVATIHFLMTTRIAAQANIAYQRWFDTGEKLIGSDAVAVSTYKVLSLPIFFSLHLAGHPANAFPWYWWLVTVINSCCWGLAVYFLYRISQRLLGRTNPSISS